MSNYTWTINATASGTPCNVDNLNENLEYLKQRSDTTDNLIQQGIMNYASNISSLQSTFKNRLGILGWMQGLSGAINVIGDSISEGFKSTDFINNSWVGILRKAINKMNNIPDALQFLGINNQGFVNFANRSAYNQYHTLVYSGFSAYTYDASYYGGGYCSSSVSGSYIDSTYTGHNAQLVYEGQTNGGVINVSIDGVAYGVVDTSVIPSGQYAKGCMSSLIIMPSTREFKKRTIRLTKADNNLTNLIGINYFYDNLNHGPYINNVSRDGLSLVGDSLSDALLDYYCNSGMVIFALGRNDGGSNTEFIYKLTRVCNNIAAKNGFCLLLDFRVNEADNDLIKTAIRQVAAQFPQFPYIDFAKIFFQDSTSNVASSFMNVDMMHPTPYGHKVIADTIMSVLGIPFCAVNLQGDIEFTEFNASDFKNDWENYNDFGEAGGYHTASYFKDDNGFVYLRGVIKGGATLTASTPILQLPPGYKPAQKIIGVVDNGDVFGSVEIDQTGSINCQNITSNSFVSLDCIQPYKAVQVF